MPPCSRSNRDSVCPDAISMIRIPPSFSPLARRVSFGLNASLPVPQYADGNVGNALDGTRLVLNGNLSAARGVAHAVTSAPDSWTASQSHAVHIDCLSTALLKSAPVRSALSAPTWVK